MIRVLIILLLGVAEAWVAPVAHNFRVITSLRAISNDNGDFTLATRRNVLGATFTAASLTCLPSASSSRERSSVPSAWPYAPSPLPSAARAPAEPSISSSLTVSYDGSDPLASFGAELSGLKTINANSALNVTGGNIDQALDQSTKKRQIDPRTHG